MSHQEYQEVLALQALEALDMSESRALDEHLADCEECRAELVELRDAAGLLAYAATPVEPRPELRAQILAAARAERNGGAETAAQVIALRPRAQTSPWPNLLKLAAAIAFVALIIGIVVLWRRESGLQRELLQLQLQTVERQKELLREREALARAQETLALLTSPSAKKAELTGTEVAQNARASFVFDRQTGRAVLLTEGLPAPPADKAYELWFIADGRPIPGKVFSVDASGRAAISDQVPPEARERAVFAVTLEPKEGVSAPTGAIYLKGSGS